MDFFNSHSDRLFKNISSMIEKNDLSLISGGVLSKFENAIADFWGNKYGLAFANGTGAIHSALFALGVKSGDEVIVPTYGFHAMVTPVLLLGATPVFCDISPTTLCLEIEHIENVITSRAKGIILLHPWGNVAEMNKLKDYTVEKNLFILSDASHAHGASCNGNSIGRYADITCVSYGKGKLISGGELGGATTDSEILWDSMAIFSHVNRVPADLKTTTYQNLTNSIGPKYRPHALSLPIALDQIRSFRERMSKLLSNIDTFCSSIKNMRNLTLQESYQGTSRVFWKIIVIIKPKNHLQVKKLIFDTAESLALSIEGDHYSPLLHQDPNYTDFYNIPSCKTNLPNAENLKDKIVQIHAPLLYEKDIMERYIELFEIVEKTTI